MSRIDVPSQPLPSPPRIGAAVAACTVVLFVWSGLSQLFPWGVPTVRNVAQTRAEPKSFGATPMRFAPGELTTSGFDEVLGNGISTLTTERSFAWIVSVPIDRYDPTRYFLQEVVSQLLCSVCLVIAALLLSPLPWRRVAGVVALFGIAAGVATYGVMTNWWGLPVRYSGGMCVNLAVGWLLGGAAITVILKR